MPERSGCSSVARAVSELRQIVVDGSGHTSLAQIVVAHVDTARVHAELESVAAARPDQVVVDLPLRHVAALRIGVVVAADGGEWRAVGAGGQHDWEFRLAPAEKLLGSKMLLYQLTPGLNWLTRFGLKDVRVADHQRPLRLRRDMR